MRGGVLVVFLSVLIFIALAVGEILGAEIIRWQP